MRKSIIIILFCVFMLAWFCLPCFAEDSTGLVNRANRLYKHKKYDEAIKLYNEAQIKSPDSAEINYNIGVAQYKKEDYVLAVNYFEKATASKDKILESKANYNIANSKYKLAKLKENTDLKETVNLLRQSLDYYKRAIELDSKDEDARINHELVERELKKLLDKLKQEQDKQHEQSGQAKENQDQAGDKQQEKKEAQQQENKRGALAQEQKAEGQKQERAEAAKVKQSEEQKQDQAGDSKTQSAEETKEMSQQEANMLLEGYRQEENSAGKLEDRKKGFSSEVLKDW